MRCALLRKTTLSDASASGEMRCAKSVAMTEPVCAPEKTSVEVARMRRVQRRAAAVFKRYNHCSGTSGIYVLRPPHRLPAWARAAEPGAAGRRDHARPRERLHGADQGPLPLR